MAFPLAAAIVAGGSLLSGGLNAASQGKMNRSSREFAKEQMWRENEINNENWVKQNQYNEGLWNKQNEYNQMAWNKENEYNSPSAQMQRYKAAGLNPHLIYGQQNTGGQINAIPQQVEGPKPAAHAEWNPKAINFDLASGLQAFQDTKLKVAQTNNTEKMNKIYDEDVKLRQLQQENLRTVTAGEAVKNAAIAFKLGLDSELRSTSVDAAKEALRNVRTGTDIAIARNDREAKLNESNLQEAMHRMQVMKGEARLKALEAQLKEYEIELNKMGLQKTDNLIYRQIYRWYKMLKGPYGTLDNNLGELMSPDSKGNYQLDFQKK